jgi:lysophospholipase L1-like esterase
MAKAPILAMATALAVVALSGRPALSGQASCTAPTEFARLDRAIAHTAAHLSDGHSLKIVAFGSSSTAGTGASAPDKTYPSRLQALLRERFPEMDVTVVNRGIGGEDAREMLARLDRDVIAEHPDLVLWQVATNAIVDDQKVSVEAALVQAGLKRLKAAGIDVVIVDPQYAPAVIRKARAGAMVKMLAHVAERAEVAVFHRYAIMSHWRVASRIPFAQFTSRDGLHMNDWSYDCLSKLLVDAIVEAGSGSLAGKVATASRSRS